MLKDREKRHRSSRGTVVAIGEPLYAVVAYACRYREGECSSRRSCYTPSLYTRVAVAVSFVGVDGVAHISFGRIIRPVPISPTLNLPISTTLNIARKGYPFQYFSRDRGETLAAYTCSRRCLRVTMSRSHLSLSMASPRFAFG